MAPVLELGRRSRKNRRRIELGKFAAMLRVMRILLEDDRVLVVLKPAGVSTQAPPDIDSLEVQLKRYVAEKRALKEPDATAPPVYLAVPHRLDRPVSGVMVFATHRRAAQKISWQFEHRKVAKTYWACVSGTPTPAEGTWTDWIRKIPGQARAQVVEADHPEGRVAILHYRTLGETAFGSWLEITLETGRTHQIRVQAASRGFPVIGDALYGSTIPFGPAVADERLRTIALHGRSLGFQHPTTKEKLLFTAGVSSDWRPLGLPDEAYEVRREG